MDRESRAAAERDVAELAGALSREIVADNRAMDEAWNLVARVEVQPNELLEFYEPSPGRIVVSGAGAPAGGMSFPDARGLAPVALWAAATDRAPPPALLSAVERSGQPVDAGAPAVEARRGGDQVQPAVAERKAVREPSQGGEWCDNEYYYEGYGDCSSWYDFQVCWDNVTGYGDASHSNAYTMYTNVCAAEGNMFLSVTADEHWVKTGSWSVKEGTTRWVWATDDPCLSDYECPYILSAVEQADGDRYHYRFLASEP